MTDRDRFTARDDNDSTVEIVAYVYGQRGASDGRVAHARITASALYVRRFYSTDGVIAGADFAQAIVDLVANGHTVTTISRCVHVHGGAVAWLAVHGAPPTPAEIEDAWHAENAAREAAGRR